MGITTAGLATALETFADRVREAREELTALDSAIGDADHGINMDRGMSAVRELLPGLREGDAGSLFKQAGRTLISTVGGASGPLYGTFFLRLGTTLGEAQEVAPGDLARGFRAGLEGIIALGKANLDDKTMVDAMVPAVEALEAGAETDVAAALGAAAGAAAAGRDRITPLVARKGRASYLGERSAGHQDPGATSTTLLFEAFRDALGSGD
ncbi:MAG TPA: dihydroxyacetone kinase subunit DhaL [Clostridia bacterium]|nr:dihydroxyacetone kinase subunit DhaL [Clostridia bacterium]